MDISLYVLLRLLWLLQFMLPGIAFVFIFAWVQRRNEVRGIKATDKIASANQVAFMIFLTFVGTAGAVAIMAPLVADLSDLYFYIYYASVVAMMVFGGFARWLMARFIRSPTITSTPDIQ